MFLIDTSVILPCLWRSTREPHVNLLLELGEDEAPVVSVITRFEVLYGTIPEFLQMNLGFLDAFQQLEIGPEISDRAGVLFRDWKKKGHNLAANDLLIGASAQIHEMNLVTKNVKHFPYLTAAESRKLQYLSRAGRKTTDTIYFLRNP